MKPYFACLYLMQNEDLHLDSILSWAYQFTPDLGLRKKEAIFLDLSSTYKLFDCSQIDASFESFAQELGFGPWRLCFAADAGRAWLQAQEQNTKDFHLEDLAFEKLIDLFDPLGLLNQKELKLYQDLVLSLKLMGIYSIAQYIRLPMGSLLARFGVRARYLSDVYFGLCAPLWCAHVVQESLEVREDLAQEIILQQWQWFEAALALSLEKLCKACQRKSLAIECLELELCLSSKESIKMHLEFPFLETNPKQILLSLKEHWVSRFRKEQEVDLWVRSWVFRVKKSRSHSFLQLGLSLPVRKRPEWNQFVNRSCSRLGQDSCFYAHLQAHYWPEQAWKRQMHPRLIQNFLPHVYRPLRLLAKPLALERKVQTLVHHPSGRSWKIKSWKGPERIDCDWWKGQETRNYFIIVTRNKNKLWVYQNHLGLLFLHGFFE